jgi:hypothetical protein
MGEPTLPKHRPQKSLQMLGSLSVKIHLESSVNTDQPNGANELDTNLARFLLIVSLCSEPHNTEAVKATLHKLHTYMSNSVCVCVCVCVCVSMHWHILDLKTNKGF